MIKTISLAIIISMALSGCGAAIAVLGASSAFLSGATGADSGSPTIHTSCLQWSNGDMDCTTR